MGGVIACAGCWIRGAAACAKSVAIAGCRSRIRREGFDRTNELKLTGRFICSTSVAWFGVSMLGVHRAKIFIVRRHDRMVQQSCGRLGAKKDDRNLSTILAGIGVVGHSVAEIDGKPRGAIFIPIPHIFQHGCRERCFGHGCGFGSGRRFARRDRGYRVRIVVDPNHRGRSGGLTFAVLRPCRAGRSRRRPSR